MMVYDPLNKLVIRDRAWAEVRQICKNEGKSYHELMGVAQQTANDWLNQVVQVPHLYLIKTEMLFGISIERLSPFTTEENKIFREWQQNANQLYSREMPLDKIAIENLPYLTGFKENARVLVDHDGVLISGLGQIEAYKKNGQNKVKVFVVDIAALIFELRSIKEMADFSKSEYIAIGHRAKQLIGNRKGQHTQLINVKPETVKINAKSKAHDRTVRSQVNTHLINVKSEKIKINIKNKAEDGTVRYQVEWIGKTNEHLAKIFGFSGKNTYYRTEQICYYGTQALIDALDQESISIDRAFKISKLAKDKQNEYAEQNALAHTLKTTSIKLKKEQDNGENSQCKARIVYA